MKDSFIAWVSSVAAWLSIGENLLAVAQLVAAFITAMATFALWRVTRVLAVETSVLAKMTSRPFVICGIESSLADPTALNFVIRNTGNAAAFDIRIVVTPPLPDPHGEVDEEATETVFELSYLPPGQVLPRDGTMSSHITDQSFSAEISWSSSPRSPHRDDVNYSFQGRDGFNGGFKEKGLHEIANELERIKNRMPK